MKIFIDFIDVFFQCSGYLNMTISKIGYGYYSCKSLLKGGVHGFEEEHIFIKKPYSLIIRNYIKWHNKVFWILLAILVIFYSFKNISFPNSNKNVTYWQPCLSQVDNNSLQVSFYISNHPCNIQCFDGSCFWLLVNE